MNDIIKQLRELANRIEAESARLIEEEYQKQPHKNFAVGDYVTNGKDIGKVGWIENQAINIVKEKGYFGLDLLNGGLGFQAPCKRDQYRLLTTEERRQFAETTERKIHLSGEDIEQILYHLSNCRKELKERLEEQRFVLKSE